MLERHIPGYKPNQRLNVDDVFCLFVDVLDASSSDTYEKAVEALSDALNMRICGTGLDRKALKREAKMFDLSNAPDDEFDDYPWDLNQIRGRSFCITCMETRTCCDCGSRLSRPFYDDSSDSGGEEGTGELCEHHECGGCGGHKNSCLGC